MKVQTKKAISTYLILVLTVFAFYNSYMHGVQLVRAHEPTGSPTGSDFGIAAIPELILIAAVLRGSDWRSLIAGSSSVIWTLGVNIAAAAGGPVGLIVALVPPVAALMCLWLTDHDLTVAVPVKRSRISAGQKTDQNRVKLTVIPEPVQGVMNLPAGGQKRLTAAAKTAQGSRVTEPVKATKLDQGIAWLAAQDGPRTIKEIQAGVAVSEATAKRIKRAVTDVTASAESKV
jgi:hypothetical protein